jgi:acetoin utilization protein AcuC
VDVLVPTPSLTVVWDDRFRDYDLGAQHPFSEISRALAASLLEATVADQDPNAVEWIRSVPPASRSALESFHRSDYLARVERASGFDEPIFLDTGDTPSFSGCFDAASRIVEGAVRGLDRVGETSRPAFHPAGGFHHAHPDRASGFCIFNDVAIAVGRAASAGQRVAYVDIDAHHGDGVMYGFYDSGRVLDIDFHQDGRTLFPGTGFPNETGRGDGAGLKVNIPLPPLSGDEALRPLFRRLVPPLLRNFRPDIIVVQHGVDGHVGDALAQLQYTPVAYAEIDATVLELAKELTRGRLLVTGGGGYRASSVSRVLARTGLLLAGRSAPDDTEPLPKPWRADYRAALNEPAPERWTTPELPAGSRWRTEDESKLVTELERTLGQKFPPPSTG